MTNQNGDARRKVHTVVTVTRNNTQCEHFSAKLQKGNHLQGLIMYLLEVILDGINFNTSMIVKYIDSKQTTKM